MAIRSQNTSTKPGTVEYDEEQVLLMQRYEEKNGVPHPGFHDTHDASDWQLPKGYADEITG